MSSTTKAPRELCAYYTTDELADALVAVLEPLPINAHILEPHVGGGAFLRALEKRGCNKLTACDIDPVAIRELTGKTKASVICCDFLMYQPPAGYSMIVGNCPYSRDNVEGKRSKKSGKIIQEPIAEEHVRHALSLLAPAGRLAFLLRIGFLASAERLPFWKRYPAKELHILAQRPSFTGGGTDSAEYALVVWERGWKPDVPGVAVGTTKILDWKKTSKNGA
jgi:hypothetical protein